MQSRFLIPTLITSALILSACVSPQQAEEQIAVADSEAGFNIQENQWSTPFWERLRQDPAQASQQASNNAQASYAPPSGVLRTSVAVTGLSATRFRDLASAAADYQLHLVPRAELAEAIDSTPACSDTTSTACADALALYPGARFVVTVQGNSDVTVTDAASGAQWPTTQLEGGDLNNELLELIRDRNQIAPWAMRAFRGDDGRLYLSAGRANGLETNMELTVHEAGTLVRAPNGQPIAWRPGDAVGKVRIGDLFGSNLATLLPVEGTQPGADHQLILDR
ncbi:hypothetical protein [uncultured Marinobacter sp.]|uniref:hypothetical protein n=1 Tax=uncultured Marinobacter sp. TaxID=187379 RepID=UPI0030DA9C64